MGGVGMLFWVAAIVGAGPFVAQDSDRVVKTTVPTELRAGANQNYKVTETLEAGTLLVVTAERVGGWLQVEVPGGFECYVHGDYLELDSGGEGRVLGDNVNLRAIPTSKDNYPITRVQRGDRLRVLERQDEWLHVLAPPSARAWVESSQVEDAGTRGTLADELTQAAADRDRAWKEESPLARRVAEQREVAVELEERSTRLRSSVDAALLDPVGVDFSGWKEEAIALQQAAPAGDIRDGAGQVLADIRAFEGSRERLEEEARKRRELQREKDELERKIQEKRQEIESIEGEAPETEPVSPSRFDAIGWVETVPKNLLGPSPLYPFQLVRGGQTQFFLHSKSGHGQKAKFQLEDFQGRLVGIRGRIRNTGGITYRVFIIEHLEVLSND